MTRSRKLSDVNLIRPIPLAGGEYGGYVVHRSTKSPGMIQVTNFDDDGNPIGDEQYSDLADALQDHIEKIDHPVARYLKNDSSKISRAWEEATFEHPYKKELLEKAFNYVSLLRPLSGVSVDGMTSADKSGRIGVLYRDEPLPIETMEHLDLVPYTMAAQRDFCEQWAEQYLAKHAAASRLDNLIYDLRAE